MNIIVTGGCGFIGSHLIKQLLKIHEHCSIANIDKLAYSANLKNLEEFNNDERLSFFQADICDEGAIREIFHNFKPNVIFNLAAESHVDRSIDSPVQSVNTNFLGTLNLLERAREYISNTREPNFRFIQVSTDEVFGDLNTTDPAWTESSPYIPSSPYSASKAGANHLVQAWHRTYQLPCIITHASNNYGAFQLTEKLIPLMCMKAINNQPLPVYGDGSQIRDWIHVEDHARALDMVMCKGQIGHTYNIGGNQEISNITLVTQLLEVIKDYQKIKGFEPSKSKISFVNDRPGHDFRYSLNSRKIKNELGWSPQLNFDQGLKNTIQWYFDHRSWYIEKSEHLQRQGLQK